MGKLFMFCILSIIWLAQPGTSHTMGLGSCPKVDPIKEFNMDKVRIKGFRFLIKIILNVLLSFKFTFKYFQVIWLKEISRLRFHKYACILLNS